MYWTDAQRGVIESSALDGSGRVVLIDERRSATSNNKSSSLRPHYYGIALDQNYLYYTDWARGSIHDSTSLSVLHATRTNNSHLPYNATANLQCAYRL